MWGVNYYVVLLKNKKKASFIQENYAFSKCFLDLGNVWDLVVVKKTNKGLLEIKGFFGKTSIFIPKSIFVDIDISLKGLNIFFKKNSNFTEGVIKSFYLNLIFSLYGVVFYHFVDIIVKGIGFRFELNSSGTSLLIFHGNVNPTIFNVPNSIKLLSNSNLNVFSVCSSNFNLINNFIGKLRFICKPGRYKEVGLFYKKRL